MKHGIKSILVFIILLIIYQLIFSFLKSDHEIEYIFFKDDKEFSINENYAKEGNNDLYYLKINDSKNDYIFTVENNFNKRKNIVKDIETYSNNNIDCMVIKLIDDKYSEPMCIKGNSIQSYIAVRNELGLGSELDKYILKYKEKTEDNSKKENSNITIYNSHFDDNEYLALYFLKKVMVYHNDSVNSFVFSTKDIYRNDYGIIVANYYVIPKLSDNSTFNSYIVYNLESETSHTIKMDEPISKNSYYNGIHDNELYITDKSSTKQYKLNPFDKTVKLIASENEDAYIYNGDELEKETMYSVASKETYFKNMYDYYKDINEEILYSNSISAYYYSNGSFYMVYNKFKDYPILLFKTNNPKNVVVKSNNIYFIEGTKLYKYNKYGLNVLVDYNEFEHNYNNIFDVYIK